MLRPSLAEPFPGPEAELLEVELLEAELLQSEAKSLPAEEEFAPIPWLVETLVLKTNFSIADIISWASSAGNIATMVDIPSASL